MVKNPKPQTANTGILGCNSTNIEPESLQNQRSTYVVCSDNWIQTQILYLRMPLHKQRHTDRPNNVAVYTPALRSTSPSCIRATCPN